MLLKDFYDSTLGTGIRELQIKSDDEKRLKDTKEEREENNLGLEMKREDRKG